MKVPIIVEERAGIDRLNEPVTVGIPFPKGALADDRSLNLRDEISRSLPLQTQVLDRWADGSCRWVLFDFQATVRALQTTHYSLELKNRLMRTAMGDRIVLSESGGSLQVVTRGAAFRLNKNGTFPIEQVVVNGSRILAPDSPGMVLVDEHERSYKAKIANLTVETSGPLRATIYLQGSFSRSLGKQPFATFFSRLHFFAGHSFLKMDFTIRNPRAAQHRGGLWDLGDPASIFFKDLSLHLKLGESDKATVHWSLEPKAVLRQAQGGTLKIYQDSSGGENWQSRNHVNRFGKVTNTFRGFRVRSSDISFQGDRAQPTVVLSSQKACLAASVQSFWQNFPKALEAGDNQLAVRLFPAQHADVFELQPGEQKTHTIYLDFSDRLGTRNSLAWIHESLIPRAQPEWYAQSEVFSYMVPESEDLNRDYLDLVHCAIEGDDNFFDRREIIDEYGWRHFGELYADHEAAFYAGPKPIISHYNNQHDPSYGFALHYARSGDLRWFDLMRDLARHVIDIDIYHTMKDKAAYNGGLFWHTDHYTDAGTSTHRTFSKITMEERGLKDYGGGPCNEHLYTTGLMIYYFLTGDPQAREAVLGLADWVMRMDNGALTRFRFFSCAATGLASQTRSRDYHGPGRGAGNSINALLDAYRLSRKEQYLDKAQELIRRCIHPTDNIDSLNLLDAEEAVVLFGLSAVAGKISGQQDRMEHIRRHVPLRETKFAELWPLDGASRSPVQPGIGSGRISDRDLGRARSPKEQRLRMGRKIQHWRRAAAIFR
jgi:exo-rhamnogalacturonan lyase-like protein